MRSLAAARRSAACLRLCAEGGTDCESACWYGKNYKKHCQKHLLRAAASMIEAVVAELIEYRHEEDDT